MMQSAFDFEEIRDYSPENFLVSPCNQEAYDYITNYPWKSYALSIHGVRGSGKTYLAKIATYMGAEVIEDISKSTDQVELFHRINTIKEKGGHVLLTSEKPLKEIGFTLPDLLSRLGAIITIHIDKPDEELFYMLFARYFAARQLKVGDDVISYLAQRVERNFIAAQETVAKIDKLSLEQKRNITIPLVKQCVK